MSIVKNSKCGWFISHENLIREIYEQVDNSLSSFQLKPELFEILTPFKTSKKSQDNLQIEDDFYKEVKHVQSLYNQFYNEVREIFHETRLEVRNCEALKTANEIYNETGQDLVKNVYGGNPEKACIKVLGNNKYLFPQNCKFFSKDVAEIGTYLKGQKFDLILLDPPWWNKYIRRKRKHSSQDGYSMMYNEELKNICLENYLSDDSIVVVWCTNSSLHFNALKNEIFPKWGLSYLGKWYWVKVTKCGEVVCPFAQPPRKQPFEQIIFGVKEGRKLPNPPLEKLVVSVPSALHSHKPPLLRLLEEFLPENPACLEIFARYLLPDCASFGDEVLRFQHETLYTKVGDLGKILQQIPLLSTMLKLHKLNKK